VLATQNPLEQEGTYPLPEAQLDRFMFLINVDYPSEEEELLVMKMGTGMKNEEPQPILNAEHILYMQQTVKSMPVADHVYRYAEKIVRSTRPNGLTGLSLSFMAGLPELPIGAVRVPANRPRNASLSMRHY